MLALPGSCAESSFHSDSNLATLVLTEAHKISEPIAGGFDGGLRPGK